MKLAFSRHAYDQLTPQAQAGLTPVPCEACKGKEPDPDCEECSGGGLIYERTLSNEESAAIEENLRAQGVPLGKAGTH